MKRLLIKQYSKDTRRVRWGVAISLLLIAGVVVKTTLEFFTNRSGRDLQPEREQAYLKKVSTEPVPNERPNIVVILADDLGYGDVSAFGSKAIFTPNLDRLVAEGVAMNNYYAPSPVCSPSRAGMLTGRYPNRAHVPNVFIKSANLQGHLANRIMRITNTFSYDLESIPHDEILLPEALGAAGYESALIGKWHLGEREGDRPNDHGFDTFYGALYSNDIHPYEIYDNKDVDLPAPVDQTQLTKQLTEKAVDFIETHADEPFFLYYASPFPHYPATASDDFIGTSKAGLYGDCVQELDWSVGEIMASLEEQGIADNTLVIFTSDNGPWFQGSPGDYRGRKGQNYDGGQGVPFIAWMPEQIQQGVELSGLASGMDIFSTVMDAAGVTQPDDRIIDGVSLLPYFKGEQMASPRDELVLLNGKKITALVNDEFKYFRKNTADNATYFMLKQGPFLYDRSIDTGENYDVTGLYPDVAATMANTLVAYEQSFADNLRGWK